MKTLLAVCALALAAIGGCPPTQELELGPIVETDIAPGEYVGDVTLTVQTLQDGEVVDEQETTQELTETIAEPGLPFIQAADTVLRVNLILANDESGLQTTQRVSEITFEGNRLTIVLDTTLASGVVQLTGEETITYEIVDDNTLAYTTVLDVSTPEIDGRSGGIAWEGTATLVRP